MPYSVYPDYLEFSVNRLRGLHPDLQQRKDFDTWAKKWFFKGKRDPSLVDGPLSVEFNVKATSWRRGHTTSIGNMSLQRVSNKSLPIMTVSDPAMCRYLIENKWETHELSTNGNLISDRKIIEFIEGKFRYQLTQKRL